MKYCVMASLRFDTPAKVDQMAQAVKDFIAGKLLWGQAINATGSIIKDYPSNFVEIRFVNEADMNDLFDLIKDRMVKLPVLKGWVSKHPCLHDEECPISCILSEKYIKE